MTEGSLNGLNTQHLQKQKNLSGKEDFASCILRTVPRATQKLSVLAWAATLQRVTLLCKQNLKGIKTTPKRTPKTLRVYKS